MPRRCFVALLCLLAAWPLWAQEKRIAIPAADRVKNLEPGVCTWACLETLAKFQGVVGLEGLTADRAEQAVVKGDHGGTTERVEDELNRRKVRFELQPAGSKKVDWLTSQLSAGRPVLIAVRNYPKAGDNHAVLVTRLNDQTVDFLDPNDSRDYSSPRSWLERNWTGWAVVLPDSRTTPRPVVVADNRPEPTGPTGRLNLLFLAGMPEDQARLLQGAIGRGRQECQKVLQAPPFSYSEAEAQAAIRRIWVEQAP
jgi:hypothetical protein